MTKPADDPNEPIVDEVYALADSLTRGELQPAEAARLETLLRESAAARRAYARFHEDSVLLGLLAEDTSAPDSHRKPQNLVDTASLIFRRPKPISLSMAAIVVSILLAIMALIFPPVAQQFNRQQNADEQSLPMFIAQLTDVHDAVFAKDQVGVQRGAHYQLGQKVKLERGWAEVTFKSGAKVMLLAPAEISLAGRNDMELTAGRLVAHVPKQAIGFSVASKLALVRDLGTEFAMAIDKDNDLETHVFAGAVVVTTADGETKLAAGQALRLSTARRIERIVSRRENFAVPSKLEDVFRPLVDGSLESPHNLRVSRLLGPGMWYGEPALSVEAEQGIKPFTGERMLRFRNATSAGPSASGGCEVYQAIDLKPYATSVAEGRLRAKFTARFNRVAIDAQTDSQFQILIWPHQGTLSSFNPNRSKFQPISKSLLSDDDPATWETVSIATTVPQNAQYLIVELLAIENVYNDRVGVEFDGHYADGAELTLTVLPEQQVVTPPSSTNALSPD